MPEFCNEFNVQKYGKWVPLPVIKKGYEQKNLIFIKPPITSFCRSFMVEFLCSLFLDLWAL